MSDQDNSRPNPVELVEIATSNGQTNQLRQERLSNLDLFLNETDIFSMTLEERIKCASLIRDSILLDFKLFGRTSLLPEFNENTPGYNTMRKLMAGIDYSPTYYEFIQRIEGNWALAMSADGQFSQIADDWNSIILGLQQGGENGVLAVSVLSHFFNTQAHYHTEAANITASEMGITGIEFKEVPVQLIDETPSPTPSGRFFVNRGSLFVGRTDAQTASLSNSVLSINVNPLALASFPIESILEVPAHEVNHSITTQLAIAYRDNPVSLGPLKADGELAYLTLKYGAIPTSFGELYRTSPNELPAHATGLSATTTGKAFMNLRNS